MAKVEIYTRKFCGYCSAAKALLTRKGIAFREYDATGDMGLRAEMIQRSSGGRTFPQILIDGRPIGGCNELYDLDSTGELESMIAGMATQ